MKRTTPDIESLKEGAYELLADAKKQLVKTGDIIPVIALLDPMDENAKTTLIAVEGPIMNSDEGKERLAADVKQQIRAHGFTAVLFLSDTFTLMLTKQETPKAMYLRETLPLGNTQLARMGYGKLTEQLTVTIETIDGYSSKVFEDGFKIE